MDGKGRAIDNIYVERLYPSVQLHLPQHYIATYLCHKPTRIMTKKENFSRMRKLVKEFEDSNQSRKAFASAHNIKEGKLQYWITKFTKPKKSPSVAAPAENKNFTPISISPMAANEPRLITIRTAKGLTIEIPL